jgi:hypothetical protein
MKVSVSRIVVDTFVVTCIGLAAAIVALEYAFDGGEETLEDAGHTGDLVDDTLRAQVCASWRTATFQHTSTGPWRDLKVFLDEHVAPELPKVFRLIGQHWLTPKTAWVWSVLNSRNPGP